MILRGLILLLFSFGSIHVFGQAALIALLFGDKVASEKFNISMELGANFSSFANVQEEADFYRPDLNFGIAGNIMLSEHFFLSPSAYFLSGRTARLTSFTPNTGETFIDDYFKNSDAELSIRYYEFPIMAYYEFYNQKFRVGLGPQLSVLNKADVTVFNQFGDLEIDYADQVNSIDYGVLTSIGYSLGEARKGKGLFLQARYYQGFTDVFSDINGTNTNSYFSFHVSLPFVTDEIANKNLLEGKKKKEKKSKTAE